MKTVAEVKAAKDLETMMNVVNNDPGHIARAKANAKLVNKVLFLPKQKGCNVKWMPLK